MLWYKDYIRDISAEMAGRSFAVSPMATPMKKEEKGGTEVDQRLSKIQSKYN